MSISAFDWNLPLTAYSIELWGARLVVPTIRSRFELERFTPIVETMWFLGFFQAEGTKRARNLGFELGNKSRVLLSHVLLCLAALGVVEHVCLCVIYGRSSEADALAYYAPLGLTMTSRRSRSVGRRQHDHGAQLTIRNSAAFVALIKAGLTAVTPSAFSPEARRAFLFGFLAGDGSVTLATTDLLRASCGTLAEAQLIAALLAEYLGGPPIEPKLQGGTFVVGRTITPFHAVDLLVGGAFEGTSSRVKLFHIAHKLDVIKHSGANRRWGYLDGHGAPTLRVIEARERLATLDDEWVYVRGLYPTERNAVMRRKGVLYEYAWQPGNVV